jgi:flagellar biosynthesis GTPase FlhF
MVMNFQMKKRGHDFILTTGVSSDVLQKNYTTDARILSEYQNNGEEFLIPRAKLCDILDLCFDHFTEESLLAITKLLNRDTDTELREQVKDRSVSKRHSSSRRNVNSSKADREKQMREEQENQLRIKQAYEEQQRQERQAYEEHQRQLHEERERKAFEEQQRRATEDQERMVKEQKVLREKQERERIREQRAREIEQRDSSREQSREQSQVRMRPKEIHRDLNYDEPVQKTELLQMISQFRQQLDVMERYIQRM